MDLNCSSGIITSDRADFQHFKTQVRVALHKKVAAKVGCIKYSGSINRINLNPVLKS